VLQTAAGSSKSFPARISIENIPYGTRVVLAMHDISLTRQHRPTQLQQQSRG